MGIKSRLLSLIEDVDSLKLGRATKLALNNTSIVSTLDAAVAKAVRPGEAVFTEAEQLNLARSYKKIADAMRQDNPKISDAQIYQNFTRSIQDEFGSNRGAFKEFRRALMTGLDQLDSSPRPARPTTARPAAAAAEVAGDAKKGAEMAESLTRFKGDAVVENYGGKGEDALAEYNAAFLQTRQTARRLDLISSKSNLDPQDAGKAQKIADALRDGIPVTPNELDVLEDFYKGKLKTHLDTKAADAARAAREAEEATARAAREAEAKAAADEAAKIPEEKALRSQELSQEYMALASELNGWRLGNRRFDVNEYFGKLNAITRNPDFSDNALASSAKTPKTIQEDMMAGLSVNPEQLGQLRAFYSRFYSQKTTQAMPTSGGIIPGQGGLARVAGDIVANSTDNGAAKGIASKYISWNYGVNLPALRVAAPLVLVGTGLSLGTYGFINPDGGLPRFAANILNNKVFDYMTGNPGLPDGTPEQVQQIFTIYNQDGIKKGGAVDKLFQTSFNVDINDPNGKGFIAAAQAFYDPNNPGRSSIPGPDYAAMDFYLKTQARVKMDADGSAVLAGFEKLYIDTSASRMRTDVTFRSQIFRDAGITNPPSETDIPPAKILEIAPLLSANTLEGRAVVAFLAKSSGMKLEEGKEPSIQEIVEAARNSAKDQNDLKVSQAMWGDNQGDGSAAAPAQNPTDTVSATPAKIKGIFNVMAEDDPNLQRNMSTIMKDFEAATKGGQQMTRDQWNALMQRHKVDPSTVDAMAPNVFGG